MTRQTNVTRRHWPTVTRVCVIAAALAWLASGCAPRNNLASPTPFDEDDPGAASAPVEAQETTTPAPSRPTTRQDVERADLNELLDAGPGAFLRKLELHPHLDLNNKFVGWEVVRLSSGASSPQELIDIRPGDVVTRVNGRPISRPDHLQAVWEELRTASRIIVAGQRDGQPFQLQFDVVEGEQPTPAP